MQTVHPRCSIKYSLRQIPGRIIFLSWTVRVLSGTANRTIVPTKIRFDIYRITVVSKSEERLYVFVNPGFPFIRKSLEFIFTEKPTASGKNMPKKK